MWSNPMFYMDYFKSNTFSVKPSTILFSLNWSFFVFLKFICHLLKVFDTLHLLCQVIFLETIEIL